MEKHNVTKKEVLQALEYFHSMGYINNLYGDAEYYTKILMRKCANNYNILLELENNELL